MFVKTISPAFSILRKTTALFLSCSLGLLDSAGYASRSNQKPVTANRIQNSGNWQRISGYSESISLPSSLGKIEESFQGSSDKTLVYIQDAHDSLEAQENIAKLIHHFVKHYGVKTVFEEGGEGPVPTDPFFSFIKDPKIKEKISYFLMDKLRIGGAEYAHINRFHNLSFPHALSGNPNFRSPIETFGDDKKRVDFRLIGADNIKLHRANVAWYRKAAQDQKETREDLKILLHEMEKLADQYFPKELKEWMKINGRFEEQKISLPDYLKRTMDLHNSAGAGLKSAPANRIIYSRIALLLSAGHSQDKKILEKTKALDFKNLFAEMGLLENDLAEKFLKNERDRRIFDYYKMLNLLQRLNELKLTQAEYESLASAYRNAPLQSYTQNLAGFIARTTKKPAVLSKRWEKTLKPAVRFYEIAQEREKAIEKGLGEFLWNPEERISVLVFGGFHKNGILEICRKNSLSCVVVSPNIKTLQSKQREYYKQLMSAGSLPFEKTPPVLAKAVSPPRIFDIMKYEDFPFYLSSNLPPGIRKTLAGSLIRSEARLPSRRPGRKIRASKEEKGRQIKSNLSWIWKNPDMDPLKAEILKHWGKPGLIEVLLRLTPPPDNPDKKRIFTGAAGEILGASRIERNIIGAKVISFGFRAGPLGSQNEIDGLVFVNQDNASWIHPEQSLRLPNGLYLLEVKKDESLVRAINQALKTQVPLRIKAARWLAKKSGIPIQGIIVAAGSARIRPHQLETAQQPSGEMPVYIMTDRLSESGRFAYPVSPYPSETIDQLLQDQADPLTVIERYREDLNNLDPDAAATDFPDWAVLANYLNLRDGWSRFFEPALKWGVLKGRATPFEVAHLFQWYFTSSPHPDELNRRLLNVSQGKGRHQKAQAILEFLRLEQLHSAYQKEAHFLDSKAGSGRIIPGGLIEKKIADFFSAALWPAGTIPIEEKIPLEQRMKNWIQVLRSYYKELGVSDLEFDLQSTGREDEISGVRFTPEPGGKIKLFQIGAPAEAWESTLYTAVRKIVQEAVRGHKRPIAKTTKIILKKYSMNHEGHPFLVIEVQDNGRGFPKSFAKGKNQIGMPEIMQGRIDYLSEMGKKLQYRELQEIGSLVQEVGGTYQILTRRIEDTKESGTTFRILIPYRDPPPSSRSEVRAEEDAQSAWMPQSVLIVENDLPYARFYKKGIVDFWGLDPDTVLIVPTAEEAEELPEAMAFGLVLLDHDLDGEKQGRQILPVLRKKYPKAVIIFNSANADARALVRDEELADFVPPGKIMKTRKRIDLNSWLKDAAQMGLSRRSEARLPKDFERRAKEINLGFLEAEAYGNSPVLEKYRILIDQKKISTEEIVRLESHGLMPALAMFLLEEIWLDDIETMLRRKDAADQFKAKIGGLSPAPVLLRRFTSFFFYYVFPGRYTKLRPKLTRNKLIGPYQDFLKDKPDELLYWKKLIRSGRKRLRRSDDPLVGRVKEAIKPADITAPEEKGELAHFQELLRTGRPQEALEQFQNRPDIVEAYIYSITTSSIDPALSFRGNNIGYLKALEQMRLLYQAGLKEPALSFYQSRLGSILFLLELRFPLILEFDSGYLANLAKAGLNERIALIAWLQKAIELKADDKAEIHELEARDYRLAALRILKRELNKTQRHKSEYQSLIEILRQAEAPGAENRSEARENPVEAGKAQRLKGVKVNPGTFELLTRVFRFNPRKILAALFMDSSDLINLPRDQKEELLKVLFLHRSEVRFIIPNSQSGLPLDPLLQAIVALNNTIETPLPAAIAYKRYGRPGFAVHLLNAGEGGDFSKEARPGDAGRIKFFRLKKELGAIAAALLYAINGTRLPGVIEKEGIAESTPPLLAFLRQEYLSRYVFAVHA